MHFVLTTTAWGRYYHYPYSRDGETAVWRSEFDANYTVSKDQSHTHVSLTIEDFGIQNFASLRRLYL